MFWQLMFHIFCFFWDFLLLLLLHSLHWTKYVRIYWMFQLIKMLVNLPARGFKDLVDPVPSQVILPLTAACQNGPGTVSNLNGSAYLHTLRMSFQYELTTIFNFWMGILFCLCQIISRKTIIMFLFPCLNIHKLTDSSFMMCQVFLCNLKKIFMYLFWNMEPSEPWQHQWVVAAY